MQEFLDSLLELSNIGVVIGPKERVSMTEVTTEAVGLMPIPISERNVIISIAKNLPEVHGDKNGLREVMVNLIENGVKFMGTSLNPG